MDIQQSRKQFILESPLNRLLWKLSLPAIAAMVFFGLNAFMDTVYVGQLLNEEALAGIALAYPLTGMLLGLGSWVGTGAGNYLSILLGENNEKLLAKVVPNATLCTLLGSMIFAIPAYVFAEELIALMGASHTILVYGTNYLKITLLASPFWVYALQLNFIVRAEGKMKKAAVMMIFGLAVNVILTPIFLKYLHMGIEGAAWATNIGMFIYCIVGYRYFNSNQSSFPANINAIQYDRNVLAQILKLGFPGFIMSIMGLIQALVVFNAVVKVGTENDLAFFAAANRIQLFLMTPLFGLMRALQPIIGVNFGAKQYSRVKKSFLLFSKAGLFLILPFWLFLMFFPELVIRLVLPDATISSSAIFNFRIYMAIIPFLPLVFMALTYLPAINHPKPATIIGIARQLVFYIPAMLVLPIYMGIDGIYFGTTIIDIIITLWTIYIVRKTFTTILKTTKS